MPPGWSSRATAAAPTKRATLGAEQRVRCTQARLALAMASAARQRLQARGAAGARRGRPSRCRRRAPVRGWPAGPTGSARSRAPWLPAPRPRPSRCAAGSGTSARGRSTSGLRGGVEPADEAHAPARPSARAWAAERSRSEPSLATTSRASGLAGQRGEQLQHALRARRSAPGRGWRRTAWRPWPGGGGRASRPNGKHHHLARAQGAHALGHHAANRWWSACRRAARGASASAAAVLRCGVTRMSLPQAEPTSGPARQRRRQPGQRAVRGEVVRVDPVGDPSHRLQPGAPAAAAAQQRHVAAGEACGVVPAPAGARAAAARRSPAGSRGWTPPTAPDLRRQRARPLQQVRAVAVADQHVAHRGRAPAARAAAPCRPRPRSAAAARGGACSQRAVALARVAHHRGAGLAGDTAKSGTSPRTIAARAHQHAAAQRVPARSPLCGPMKL
jgi:hypothetical protein